MNNELAIRTLAYLITHYKEHDETIINSEEIEAYIMACFIVHEQTLNALIRNQKYILGVLDEL